MEFLTLAAQLLADVESNVPILSPDLTLPANELLFGPFRLVGLIAWIYLCMYTVQRVEYSPLVSEDYREITSLACLFIGPFIFFVLAVADVAVKLQEGQIALGDVFKYLFGNAFVSGKGLKRGKVLDDNYIELLDSAGNDFFSNFSEKSSTFADQEVIGKTRSIVLNGIKSRASDILIDPKSTGKYTVRYRVDGFLRVVDQIETAQAKAVVNSIKAISAMDISEKRRALDGAFMAKIAAGDVYFRVASAGVLGGEKLSIRVLNQATGMIRLHEVGLSEDSYKVIRDAVNQPQGMIVVCGPTGSGKSTSLYAMLNEIDFYTRNVVTVEDPIEYMLPHASQIEVNPKADITFANSLRSILRQDPDVICVGEIRDSETAQMAIQASNTGHLLLATLHSSSNMATLARLIDLGIKPLILASALHVIISQRLVRKLCENCKKPAELTEQKIISLQRKGYDPGSIYQAHGCKKCNDTGYTGRVAIVDVMHLSSSIKEKLAADRLELGDLKKEGDDKGRGNLRKEGLKKVLAGITTFEEVKRVTTNLG